ncbi:MAG: electron transport complex protein RnfB [Candidatus Paceibacteria bacterium]|jgi:electron transport complex protein RnfB
MAENQTTTGIDLFSVDKEACIACDACCQEFPEVFFMDTDDKANTIADQQASLYNARTVVDVCPTDAIHFSGEVPEPVDLGKLEEVEGWEVEWSKWRSVAEDKIERDRRYGRDFEITEGAGYVVFEVRLPQKSPNVRDRYRFGMPEIMPEYGAHDYQAGQTLHITAWVKDPQMRALAGTSNSFPQQFTKSFDLPDEIVGRVSRFDAHGIFQVVLFTDPAALEAWEWKAHFITDLCTSCGICERVCPTNAITSGDERFHIEPDLCINCSVCGVYCPFDAINDSNEVLVGKIKPKQIPKAVVHEELCTGCRFCEDVCPFDAIGMKMDPDSSFNYIAEIYAKKCTSCKLCEQVCIKDAIEVPRNHQFADIGMSFMSYLTDEH